jgi:hypothetical protein
MKNFLALINGWKTAIAAIYWPTWTLIVPIWFPTGMPDTWNKAGITVGILLTATGVGHKWYKATHEATGDAK